MGRLSIDGSSRISAFVRNGEPGIGVLTVEHHARRQLSDRGSMLEAMTGSTANDPDVVVLRMAIDQEVTGLGVLVRTHAGLDDGRAGQRRHPARQPLTRTAQAQ